MKYYKIIFFVTFLSLGCSNYNEDDILPHTLIEKSGTSEHGKFRKTIVSKISNYFNSDEERRIDVLGKPILEQTLVLKNDLDQRISFTPVFNKNSSYTEAVIIGVQAKNYLRIIAIERGKLSQLPYKSGNRHVSALTYAGIFDTFDRSIFNLNDANYGEIIYGPSGSSARLKANIIINDSINNQKSDWVDIEQCIQILSGYGPENTDPDVGFSYEQCSVIGSYWVDTPGNVIIDGGSSGGGSPGTYFPWSIYDFIFESYEDLESLPCNDNLDNIPSTITTTDGTNVSISFGVSADGTTSNQAIAPGIIHALEHALNKANVGYTNKITEIFISTTNNGSHSEHSNHFKNKAIDISRINGTRLSEMTDLSLANRLQDAFELYSDIRENFGPNFTHKKLENHTVADHSDHIHVSTNDCN